MTVDTGSRQLCTETIDVSSFGAKLRMEEMLEPGSRACLHLSPHDQRPLAVQALVWRADPDGLAFFFWEVWPTPTEA